MNFSYKYTFNRLGYEEDSIEVQLHFLNSIFFLLNLAITRIAPTMTQHSEWRNLVFYKP